MNSGRIFTKPRGGEVNILALSELQIMAGQRTMSGQDDYLSRQNFGSAVILTGHVHGFQIK